MKIYLLLFLLCIIPLVSATSSLDKISLSSYIQQTLINNYNASREYSTCIGGMYWDNTFHATTIKYIPQDTFNNILANYSVHYIDGIFYGTYDSIYTVCSGGSIIQLHSHPDNVGFDNCYPSSVDLLGWKNFTSVQYYIIQCSPEHLRVFYKVDLIKGIVRGYDYNISNN